MRALWHALFWPAAALAVLLAVIGGIVGFFHTIAEESAKYAEKKLRAHRVRA